MRIANDPLGGRAAVIEARAHRAAQADRGAALIVALGVLVFLIIISTTFWQATRREMQTATNTADSIRAELLTDGAFAIAIAFLNHDLAAHPSYTSLDHAWRSYFNGSWAVGKPWLWADIRNEQTGLIDPDNPVSLFNNPAINRDPETLRGIPGIPEIDLMQVPNFQDGFYIPRIVSLRDDGGNFIFPNRYADSIDTNNNGIPDTPLYPFAVSSDLGDSPVATALVPDLSDTVFRNFSNSPINIGLISADTVPANDTLPAEQIHFWTDVDNDRDGLNDSMWLPIGGDVIADADGLDNNLNNGFAINSDEIDNNLDGIVDDGFDGIDEPGETAIFLYDGTADGLDNNGDGIPDDPDERSVFFTTRIFNFIDGNINDLIDLDAINNFAISPGRRDELGLNPIAIPTNILDAVDVIDNNFDLMVNGAETFVVGPFDLDDDHRALGYHQIAPRYLIDDTNFVSSTGETVSEIVGRVAILITDEASKVNINAAGAYNFFDNSPFEPGAFPPQFPMFRSFGSGIGPHEYETRVLPGIGVARASRLWTLRTGAPQGVGFVPNVVLNDVNSVDQIEGRLNPQDENPFAFDVSLPGFGKVDDNGNALALALNGIDDDGDADFYQNDGIDNDPFNTTDFNLNGDGLDNNLDGFIDDGNDGIDDVGEGLRVGVDEGLIPYDYDGDGFTELAALEGIDEPQEFQRFRPLRNSIAESDSDSPDPTTDGNFDGFPDDPTDEDNDNDGVFDEIGELGDRFYRTHEQLKLALAFEFDTSPFPPTGLFGDIRNFITAHSQDRNDRHSHRDVPGDFSDDRQRRSTGPKLDYNLARAEEIADALRNDWRYPISEPLVVNAATGIPVPDPQLGNLAARYALGLRREDTTVVSRDRLLGQGTGSATSVAFEADASLRAEQLGVSIKDFTDRDFARSELTSKIPDAWWAGQAAAAALIDPTLSDAANAAQGQRISYTVAGIESVRINEIMVRPVRRFEAEAITSVDDPVFFLDPTDPDFVNPALQPALNPNRFTPNADVFNFDPADPLPDFRMRVRTTRDRLGDAEFDGFVIMASETQFSGADVRNRDWFRYIPGVTVPFFPFQTSGLPLMGLASAYTTYQSYISVVGQDGSPFNVPDVVQFSFQATNGLPPGRYYLKVNTEYIDAFFDASNNLFPVVRASAIYEADLSFIFKLNTLDRDILTDIMIPSIETISVPGGGTIVNTGIALLGDAAWRVPAIVGSELLGGSTGTAFLQADNVYRGPVQAVGLGQFPALTVDFNFGAVTGFTIEVPGIDDDVNTEDLWLHVAVRSMRGDGQPLVLNYFDFSQEPDHEWVELVNVDTDTAVDVSGWELAVEGGDRLVMTIPGIPGDPDTRTLIAPGGMLLLGTNKFDGFEFFDPQLKSGAFFENGIGLASESFGTPFADPFAVTVPRTRRLLIDGSVFTRSNALDFIDRNGDGSIDGFTPDDAVVSTLDFVQGSNDPAKAWDRIVELAVPTLPGRFTAADIGAIVLAGGIFPNRPEYDGVDNDLDNFILSTDHIDNDGDGFLDEAPTRDGFDNDFDGVVDETGERDPDLGPDEGIDEGRFRRERFDQFNFPVPGAFNTRPSDFSSAFFGSVPPYAAPNTFVESPRWKEFIERRNFPGDNVIITLYEGPAFRNRVVDRVTYNQRDVENSAIDDVVRTTYRRLEIDDQGFITNPNEDTFTIPEPLDENFISFWPGNTMGVDFYRSLERKHPLYNGDRFGTQNRFTATDGNYDDWADSTGRWERVIDDANRLQPIRILDRFSAAFEIYNQFAHAFHGSPLRMNATQRYAQELPSVDVSPFDPAFASAQFARKAMFEAADARNRNIVSAGDLLTLPHISKTNDLVTLQQFPTPADAFLFDVDSPNVSFAFNEPPPVDTFRENLSYNQALLGQNFDINDPQGFFQDIRAVIGNAAANSSLALSVGQAEVFLLVADTTPITDWGVTGSGIPEAWVPVLLHDLIDDNPADLVFGIYQHRYLMQRPFSLPDSVANDRWPAESREAFYVSGNNQGFDPTEFHIDGNGAESLFVWDGNDGLENGEYVLYLVMGDDLRTLLRAHINSGENLLTTDVFDSNFFGENFVQKAIQTAPEERIVDVKVFTDRNGDRRVWTDTSRPGFPQDGLPQTAELNDGDNLDEFGRNVASETFGLEAGLQADASGIIRYGVIRVENNYLAVMLRNWSDAGNINMFSRVVLAPRDKTPGRININTVQTRRIDNAGGPGGTNLNRNLFNPLVGLPGILARVADSNSLGPLGRPLSWPVELRNFDGDEPQDLARQIVEQRQRSVFEAPDGRYYELTSDLLDDEHGLPSGTLPSGLFLQPPLVIVDHEEEVSPGVFIEVSNLIDTTTNNRIFAFTESAFRFGRMQNLITTRSDVFEIIVTVQAGYGTDTNGDGRINYRDDREFTATAEKSARTVYER